MKKLALMILAITGMAWLHAAYVMSQDAVVKTEYETFFADYNVNGSFVLYDRNHNKFTRYQPQRCRRGFLPGSTFKIFHTLIALDNGLVKDADHHLKWDGRPHKVASWNQDHTLASAFKNSVPWYYQELARQLGLIRMQEYLDELDYGNQDLKSGIDRFWLEGGLRISQEKQIELLIKLYNNDLPFTPRSMRIAKELMIMEETPGYIWRGKTGWVAPGKEGEAHIGWLVGFLEKADNVYFYALNIETPHPNRDFGPARKEITRRIFQDLNLLDS